MLRENSIPEGIARDSWVSSRNRELGKLLSAMAMYPINVVSVVETDDGYIVSDDDAMEGTSFVSYQEFMEWTSIERRAGLL